MSAAELVAFLTARLDEDEAAALLAKTGSGRWHWDHGEGDMCNDHTCPYGELVSENEPDGRDIILMEVHGYDVKEPWQGAAHIARHDPARVLREVEADRALLEAHARMVQRAEENSEKVVAIMRKGWRRTEDEQERLGSLNRHGHELTGRRVGLEHAIRLRATVHAGHPDYREEWRP